MFSLESLAIFPLTQNKLHMGHYVHALSEKVDDHKFHTQHHTDRQYLDGQTGSSGTVGFLVDRVCLLLHHYECNDYRQLIPHRPALFQVC